MEDSEYEEEFTTKQDETPLTSTTRTPKDQFCFVYILFITVSVGILFPYNSYILAIDYFLLLYPNQHPELTLPLAYLAVTLLFVFVTINVANFISLHVRIGIGYILFGIPLLFVILLDFGVQNCTVSATLGFVLTFISFMVVGIGSGIQQPSYYGLAGMLPEQYTHAMMLGESVAGTLVSVTRIITKSAATDERTGVLAFFAISFLFNIICVVCQVILWKSPFVRHYVEISSRKSSPLNLDNNDDVAVVSSIQETASTKTNWINTIRSGIKLRFRILKKIWKYALQVFMIFFVTLLIFPGLSSIVQDCSITDWPPVILTAVFSFMDFISRLFSRIPLRFRWKPVWLIIVSFLRVILVPLFLLCVTPSPTYPIIPVPYQFWLSIVLIAMVGVTNGYFGTLGMQHAPQVVNNEEKELTGIFMVFFLLGGLTAGSMLAFVAWMPLTSQDYKRCTNFTAELYCQSQNFTLLN